MSKVRLLLIALTLAVIVSACGESGPLERAGEASSGWVTAVTTPTTTAPPVVIEIGNEGLIGADDVLWANDDIGPVTPSSDPRAAIAAVWDRQLGSRFVQASRAEIAAALPTIRFPEAVPEDVRWMTSQLVFDPATGLLDVDTSAAFGLWTVEPYTVENGRLGVLRVGSAPDGVGAAKSDIVPIIVPDGLSLGWTEAGLRYEFFCRVTIPEPVCTAIVDSFVPLTGLLST
ncbi:MAG: lipoprotein [Acidimicrobiia bacterium]